MSRHVLKSKDRRYEIAYGFDPIPMGGYYFQVFDKEAVKGENEEGLIVNEGFLPGIKKEKMYALLSNTRKYNIPKTDKIVEHLNLVSLDQPI